MTVLKESAVARLNDDEQLAVQLAHDLRERMNWWLAARGVNGSVAVSPFVDSAGQPNLLIRANAHIARALVLGLEERAQPSLPRSPDGAYRSEMSPRMAQPRLPMLVMNPQPQILSAKP
jgi:hypothetical protein